MAARAFPPMRADRIVDERDRIVVHVEHADAQSWSRSVGPKGIRTFKESEHAWGSWRLDNTEYSYEHWSPELQAQLPDGRSLSRFTFVRR